LKIATYDQWIDAKWKSLKPSDNLTCINCEGGGVIYEDCHSCGHESEENCHDCDGRGSIKFSELSGIEDLKNYLTKKEYFQELFKDLSDFADYINARPMNIIGPVIIEMFSHRHGIDTFQLLCDAAKDRPSNIARRL